MKAARITEWNTTPKLVDISAPPAPGPDEVQIRVLAAGVHTLVRSRLTGKHFSATTLPHIPGSDGVGRTIPDNKLVYFTTFWEKGSFAEIVNVTKRDVTPMPEDSDPVKVAGLINPALSSWMAFKARTFNLPKDFSVVVLGGTTVSGAIALSLARILGAGKVIGVARNVPAMQALGYDDTIELQSDVAKTDYSKVENVDVVLDYIYGPATVALFNALKPTTPVQYIQIGALSSPTADLPAALLRAKDISMRGAAPGSYSMEKLAEELPKLLEVMKDVKAPIFKVVSLDNVEREWPDSKSRLVFTVNQA
jgi:NADPH:quinone reductase-like Zn-dependent oxidoreductase